MDQVQRESGTGGTIAAWLVHAFTASGVVIALVALVAIERGDFRQALLWLVLGLAVDAFDGSLARWARVKERAARIDGDTLDLIIDYLNYVFVPAVLILRAGLVPPGLAPFLAGLILVSALYNFTRRDLKTHDNYFRGFPALWNVIAFYFFVAQPGALVAVTVIVVLAGLTFAPVNFVHPFRVRDFGRLLPLLSLVWAAATALLLWPGWDSGAHRLILAFSLITAAILVGMGFWRTFRGDESRSDI